MSEYRPAYLDDAKLADNFKQYAAPLSVLLVEDDEGLRESNARILKRAFGQVFTAYDGQDAWEQCQQRKFDLLLVDINMPRKNGIELIRDIRQSDSEQAIIVLSAFNESQYYNEFIFLGIDAFILKPINMLNFIFTVTRSCKAIYDSREVKRLQKEVVQEQNRTISYAHSVENGRQITDDEMELLRHSYDKISAQEFHDTYPTDLMIINDKLEPIDDELDIMLDRFIKNQDAQSRDNVCRSFEQYAIEVAAMPEFNNLAVALDSFAENLAQIEHFDNVDTARVLLFELADNLRQWRIRIFETKETDNVHYLDASLINDCLMAEAALKEKALQGGGDVMFL